MSSFYDIERTFSQAIQDLTLGIDIREQNEDFDPPESGQWGEISFIANDIESGMKDDSTGKGMDEVTGIAQISLFDADVGTLGKVLLQLGDTIATEFKHGKIFQFVSLGNVEVFIQNTKRGTARMNGGYFQLDMSIDYLSYVDR